MAASQIDLAKPVGNWREAIETRQNFAVAAAEIEALGGGGSGAIADLQAAVADLQTRVTALEQAVAELRDADPTP